jgi:hypothetical protein
VVRLVLLAFAAALLPLSGTSAHALSAKALLRQCEALEKGVIRKGEAVELPAGRAAAECWYYMAAVQDFAATVQEEGGPSILGSCPSPTTTRMDLIRAFTKYAKAHRQKLDERASAMVIQALAETYRCRKP